MAEAELDEDVEISEELQAFIEEMIATVRSTNIILAGEMLKDTLYGDIIVIAVDNNNNPINVDFEDLEEFCPMSIDDETTDEELGLDEYVYDDWCIDDRELSDEEMGMD